MDRDYLDFSQILILNCFFWIGLGSPIELQFFPLALIVLFDRSLERSAKISFFYHSWSCKTFKSISTHQNVNSGQKTLTSLAERTHVPRHYIVFFWHGGKLNLDSYYTSIQRAASLQKMLTRGGLQ